MRTLLASLVLTVSAGPAAAAYPIDTVGARMLDWANNLLCVAYTCQTDAQGYILLNADGTPKLKLDAKTAKPILNPDYPGGDAGSAEQAYAEWKKLIPDGTVPNTGTGR